MMAGMRMVALSETLTLAERLGLQYQTAYDVMTKASGNCWALQVYCPVPGPAPASPANREYAPGFAMAMMLKDMRLSQSTAKDVSTVTPIARSEEHTSELQSLMRISYAVFCLKKKIYITTTAQPKSHTT